MLKSGTIILTIFVGTAIASILQPINTQVEPTKGWIEGNIMCYNLRYLPTYKYWETHY